MFLVKIFTARERSCTALGVHFGSEDALLSKETPRIRLFKQEFYLPVTVLHRG